MGTDDFVIYERADSMTSLHAVLFRSGTRFSRFQEVLKQRNIGYTVLDFDDPDWIDYDFEQANIVIYYPSFDGSTNDPLSLSRVTDNLAFVAAAFRHLVVYPDPSLLPYYNDKYRQYLFLTEKRLPMPDTVPLVSQSAVDSAATTLGFPLVVKNRYGAGGDYVFLVASLPELHSYFRLSRLDLVAPRSLAYLLRSTIGRIPLYYLLKVRRAQYPFLSYPLLAQRFLRIDRDLKTVCRDTEVVEGHWRLPATPQSWKTNIDGGGIGEWSCIPDEALELSARLAATLRCTWLNIDLLYSGDRFFISEFSPVWHHYSYREKDNFVYADNYNIRTPLSAALDLEALIVDDLIRRARPTE